MLDGALEARHYGLGDSSFPMTASIEKGLFGISAFTADGHLTMNGGSPCVAWHFRIKELEEWLTTLEEMMPEQVAHRRILEGLYFSLKAAHAKHKKQHEEIVTETPTADDLMEYLVSYAAAIGNTAQ